MPKLLITLMAAAGIMTAMPTYAAMTKDQYKSTEDQIESTYKADKQACSSMKGNAKDVCQAEAKAKEKVAKAQAEADYKNTDKARRGVAVAKADSDYSVAKEKCDDMSGDAKKSCVKDAKANHDRAKANAKSGKMG